MVLRLVSQAWRMIDCFGSCKGCLFGMDILLCILLFEICDEMFLYNSRTVW